MDASLPDVVAPTPDSEGSGESSDHILCATVESVSVDGVAPEAGDTVSAKVEGSVSKVEGDRVYLKVAKVNGADVPDASADEAEPANDEDAMLRKAEAADSQSYA